jgi:hypothetical protein
MMENLLEIAIFFYLGNELTNFLLERIPSSVKEPKIFLKSSCMIYLKTPVLILLLQDTLPISTDLAI